MAKHTMAAVVAALILVGASSGVVSAHANLLHSNIKNNEVFSVGHTPKMVTAFFAEDLESPSWMAIFEGVADHGLVTEKQHSHVNFKNPKEMILPLPSLAKDKYYLIWYTHSADDGHYAAGILYFQVK